MTELTIQELVPRLRGHVQTLAGEIGERNVWCPNALHAAEAYIRECWREHGHEVVSQEYTAQGVSCSNLEITFPGARPDGGILLIGAHYDTVPGSPGADDNASGVASLLELGRLLRRSGSMLTIRLLAFVNEEMPFFHTCEQGSMVYAAAARQRGDDIRLMVSLEMLGYYSDLPGSQRYPPLLRAFFPSSGNFIGFVSNFRSRRKQRRLVAAFREACEFPVEQLATFSAIPGVSWSDHQSFWQHHYHALMVTDTAFYRYPWYHTAQDTPEQLDYTRLAAVTAGLSGALSRIATAGI